MIRTSVHEKVALLCAIFALVALSWFGYRKAFPAGPSIYCAQPDFNWGKVAGDRALTCIFEVRNVGASNLKILKASTSCSCTIVNKFSNSLQPGESTLVPVQTDVRNHSGPVKEHVVLTTNDPNHPYLLLQVIADVDWNSQPEPIATEKR